ncbi:methyltransferase [Rhodobacteraceae bacterium XHP0102]|nr:methyltransferase [Rhodobacteraceae bacterium XHP0102]
MGFQTFSSGDAAADRRAAFAETLAHLGDAAGAVEALRAALDLVPNWAAGWYRLGEYHEASGEVALALSAWKTTLALDPSDPFGAAMKSDLIARKEPITDRMPAAFVETLFDQYAPRFERALRGGLGYRAPEMIAEGLRASGFVMAASTLDLGCGTGLMGQVIRPLTAQLTGYDLSSAMLAEAQEKGCYDYLQKCDIAELPLMGPRYDLILAADVFNYIGALEQVIGWCADALYPQGRLGFSVEAGAAPLRLMPSRRFAHSQSYIRDLLEQAGFAHVQIRPGTIRQDRGVAVAGLIVLASRAAIVQDRKDDDTSEMAL